ncbi:MAG: tyrosine-protein phosphatase, partial [Clostridiales bacterium]|nr:tyrosine-protein phosphatase [Clostridiales bacterium]MDY5726818.1 tyrosine-protein phosphatase [Eubacteriales bacterium]
MKILHLDNLNNFRDIANDSVREGVLLRSAKIDDLTDEGRDLLVNKYNVKTIIDLRTLSETKEQIAPDGVEFFNVSMTKTPIFGITKYKKG